MRYRRPIGPMAAMRTRGFVTRCRTFLPVTVVKSPDGSRAAPVLRVPSRTTPVLAPLNLLPMTTPVFAEPPPIATALPVFRTWMLPAGRPRRVSVTTDAQPPLGASARHRDASTEQPPPNGLGLNLNQTIFLITNTYSNIDGDSIQDEVDFGSLKFSINQHWHCVST